MDLHIRDVIDRKGTEVLTIRSEETVFRAIEVMEHRRVGALVVLDERDNVVGMITERDYLRKVALRGRSSKTTRVEEIMSKPVACTSLDDRVQHALAVMTERRCRHLPVIDGDGLAGLVSIGDLVKQIAQERKVEIRYLEDYITGKYPA